MTPAAINVFAPCRLGLAGGGTDVPAYAARFGGAVLSATITLGASVRAEALSGAGVRLELADFGVEGDYGDVAAMRAHAPVAAALVAAVINEVRPGGGVALRVATGLPPGSGLGTSGAVGVALTYALAALNGGAPDAATAAELASIVEIERLGRPIGRQDQYAAAYGGLNLFRFDAGGVTREPLALTGAKRADFNRHFMLFFSGRRRDSAAVLTGQRARVLAGDEATLAALHRNRDLAPAMAAAAVAGDFAAFGGLMHDAWEAKLGASQRVADARAVAACEGARARGAWAMKVTGAGAGGFYLVMAPPARQAAVAAYLAANGFERYDFAFDDRGVRPLAAGA